MTQILPWFTWNLFSPKPLPNIIILVIHTDVPSIYLFQMIHFYTVQCIHHHRDHCQAGAVWLVLWGLKKTFFFFFGIHTVSRLHLDNYFKTRSKKWQMECCCFSFLLFFSLYVFTLSGWLHPFRRQGGSEWRQPAPSAVIPPVQLWCFSGAN